MRNLSQSGDSRKFIWFFHRDGVIYTERALTDLHRSDGSALNRRDYRQGYMKLAPFASYVSCGHSVNRYCCEKRIFPDGYPSQLLWRQGDFPLQYDRPASWSCRVVPVGVVGGKIHVLWIWHLPKALTTDCDVGGGDFLCAASKSLLPWSSARFPKMTFH